MKKVYEKPLIEIIEIDGDVITASTPVVDEGSSNLD